MEKPEKYPKNIPQENTSQQSYPQTTPQPSPNMPQYPQNIPTQNIPPDSQYTPSKPLPQYGQDIPPQKPSPYQHNFTHEQMRHYFYKPSVIYTRLLIAGVILFLLGIAAASSGLGIFTFITILGFGLASAGGILIVMHNSDQPSEKEYTQWVAERSQPLYKKALQRLHLDESQCESIVEVQGGISSMLQLTQKFPGKEIVMKRLHDGYRHYSINVCTYIFLTKNDIAIYSGYINALTQNERFEDADHYYYKDIVGVSTSGPIYTSWNGLSEKETQMQGFIVRINNGDAIGTDYAVRVVLRNIDVNHNTEVIEGVDQVVAAMLYLLHDHKLSQMEVEKVSRDLL